MNYSSDNPYNESYVVEIDEVNYLVIGRIDDELVMIRKVSDLLECERDNVQQMIGEQLE